jgi:ribonuclease VapC
VSVVLDASAVLVLPLDEPGAEVVAEVLSKVTARGADVAALAEDLVTAGVLVEPMTAADAAQVAEIRRIDQGRLLSLGGRCCLALGRRLGSACADRRPGMVRARRWSGRAAGPLTSPAVSGRDNESLEHFHERSRRPAPVPHQPA